MACSLVAVKLGVKVAHVEAGLRSFDRSMPEEINRLVTDAISDLLFVSERSGIENLKKEGVAESRIHFVGNIMIDTLLQHRHRAKESDILSKLGLAAGEKYALATLHRPSNVDDPEKLRGYMSALQELSREASVIFPIHPRTRNQAESAGLTGGSSNVKLIDPLGYLDFLQLMDNATVVITDSGGIQEETTVLGVPCLTVRDNTERPATIEQGTNRLIGSDPAAALKASREILRHPKRTKEQRPELWDGQAAGRIVAILSQFLAAVAPV
jgi:UDP-N-acetylglucosamine 2-epimerase (non-hydrolysing)